MIDEGRAGYHERPLWVSSPSPYVVAGIAEEMDAPTTDFARSPFLVPLSHRQ